MAGEKLARPGPRAACEPAGARAALAALTGISLGLSASYFVSAQRFCSLQQAGELKPAACLLAGEVSSRRRWKEGNPGEAFPEPAVTGTQLSHRPGQGWGSADGGVKAMFGAVPLLWDALCSDLTVKSLQALGAKEENFCSWEFFLCQPPAVHSLSHSAAQY